MSKKNPPLNNASEIIDRFGGIRPMAGKIDTPVTTVQGWKKRDTIPGTRRDQIVAAANENNIDLSDLLDQTPIVETDIPDTQEAKTPNETIESPPTPTVKPDKPTVIIEESVRFGSSKQKGEEVSSIKADIHQKASEDLSKMSQNNAFNDALLQKMEENSKKTMITSAWIAVFMILVASGVGFALLYPGFQKNNEEIQTQTQKIETLETEVKDVKNTASFVENIIPRDIQTKMSDLRARALTIEQEVNMLSQKAQDAQNKVLGENAGPLSERLKYVEDQLTELSNNPGMPMMENMGDLASLIGRIQNLEGSMESQGQLQDALAQLQGLVVNLDQKTGSLEGDLSQIKENGNNSTLGQTLDGVSNQDLKAAAMLIAFSQLRDSLNRQSPFEDDLVLLQKLAGNDNEELNAAIQRLAPHSASGVLTTSGLGEEFKGLAGDIVFSSLKGEDVSLQDQAKARIQNLLQVEKDGQPILATPTQQTVSNAQKMLDDGNIEGAIAALQTLDGEAAQTAQPFLEQAQATLMAEQAEKLLGENIMQAITQQMPGGLSAITNGGNINSGAMMGNFKNMTNGANLNGSRKLPQMPNDIMDALPIDGGNVVTDQESGVSVYSRQPSFKGFTDKQE